MLEDSNVDAGQQNPLLILKTLHDIIIPQVLSIYGHAGLLVSLNPEH